MAGVPSELGARGDKQDVAKIYGALHSCIAKMPKDQLRRVIHIAVCGQMHGVVFWKDGEAWSRWVNSFQGCWFTLSVIRNAKDQLVVDTTGGGVSSLYTWQDGRCDPGFLASLPRPCSHLGLSTGYGCATMFWLLRNRPEYIQKFDR